jgi:glycosyltransferase involved in cell wall biosynthesis
MGGLLGSEVSLIMSSATLTTGLDRRRDIGYRVGDASSPRRLLSIVLPAYNEQEVLGKTYARFSAECPQFARYGLDYELVFVNDGSADRTPAILDELSARDPHVRAVHLTRNFGHQAAISAGLTVARGDAVAIMDCDLQDPPEVLPPFIEKWQAGNQVVYAIRQKRKEWFGKRLAYWAFYRLLAAISDLKIPLDSGDFCLMDRTAVDLLNALPERQRFVRGLRTWVGLKQVGVEYERAARQAGVPQYTFTKLVKLAMDGLVSFSSAPLRFVTRLGVLSAAAAMALGLWVVGITTREWLMPEHFRKTPRGWASLACLVLLMSSVQLLSLGIIGEYLARIFQEVKGRPTFLIARIAQQQQGRLAPDGAADREVNATAATPDAYASTSA